MFSVGGTFYLLKSCWTHALDDILYHLGIDQYRTPIVLDPHRYGRNLSIQVFEQIEPSPTFTSSAHLVPLRSRRCFSGAPQSAWSL